MIKKNTRGEGKLEEDKEEDYTGRMIEDAKEKGMLMNEEEIEKGRKRRQ